MRFANYLTQIHIIIGNEFWRISMYERKCHLFHQNKLRQFQKKRITNS